MKKYNVLVVDDNEVNLDILVNLLCEEYTVSVAVDGESFLEVIDSTLPDIILLDIELPDISGYRLCEQLKQNKRTANIPVVFVTGKDHTDDEEHGLLLGAVDYITKPIIPKIVKARVKNHLDLKFANEKLQKQNKELEQMLKLREELSQMIVHDIRSPIAAILGACEMATLEELSESISELIEDINYQAKHANSFLNDMLLLAKGNENQLVLHRKDVDIKKIIVECGESYKFISQAKNIQIKYQLPPENKIYSIDENLFKRVLDNLLSNAFKFSPTNEVITFILECNSPGFRIQVCDNGPGIPDNKCEIIFAKYKTVKTKKKNIQQIGLGLSFCKMVVEAHNGKIYAKNNLAKGSVFVIEI